MSAAVRWCVVLLIFVVAVSGQKTRQTLKSSPNSIQLADDVIAKDRSTRTIKKVKKTLGFFGTIKNLVFEQINDTRSAYDQLSGLINNNFADDNAKSSQISVATSVSSEDDTEATTTQPPPPKITRDEFLNILRRNIIGLRRLFDQEWKQAMIDSRKNILDYKSEFKSEMYKQVSGESK